MAEPLEVQAVSDRLTQVRQSFRRTVIEADGSWSMPVA
jgi:hypothetical protein